MSNLRSMIDGIGSLAINANPEAPSNDFKVSQDVVIRRRVNRSGPVTNEILVGRILAMDGNLVDVSIQKSAGVTERRTVHVRDLSPVTRDVRNQSNKFSPQFRRGV